MTAPTIVKRAGWGAKPPTQRSTFKSAPDGVFLHYTAAAWDRTQDHADCPDRVRRIQSYHMGPSRGWNDVAYSMLYCRHGVVFEGRGWGVQGAHTIGFNGSAHAFCFLGTDRDGRDDVTDKGRAAVSWLIGEASRRYPEGKGKVRGHGDVNPTACPGAELRAFIATRGWLDDSKPGGTIWAGYWKWLAWYLGEGAYLEAGPRHKPSRPKVPNPVPDAWKDRRDSFLLARE
jgi:N-acetylmuramoyl-L-alanine amidase